MIKIIFKTKKGTAASEMWAPDTILFWIIFGIVLGFVAIFFVVTISKIGFEQAKINENLESLFLMQRFLKSQDCFAYSKEGTLSRAVIDADKFTEEMLSSCYIIAENTLPAFRLTLSLESAGISKAIKTKNWNDNRPFEEKKTPKNVVVHSGNKLQNGEILVEIQNLR